MKAYKLSTVISKNGKISLPDKLKSIFNHKVEIVVLDLEKEPEKLNKKSEARGFLRKYADADLIRKEKSAMDNALKKKHEIR